MLTDIQKARTRFHLGYPNDQIHGPTLEVEQNLVLGNLAPMTELGLVGDPDNQTIEFQGLALCAPNSLLARLEAAWDNISADVISDSLFVSQAGSVTLRKDELRARMQLYNQIQSDLSNLLDVELFTLGANSHHARY